MEHKQVQKWDGTTYPEGKSLLLTCHTCCKCSIENTRNSMKVKLGIKVINLMKSLVGMKVTVGDAGSEFHLTFVKETLHIAE